MKKIWIMLAVIFMLQFPGIITLAAEKPSLALSGEQIGDVSVLMEDYQEKIKEALKDLDEKAVNDVFSFLKEKVKEEDLYTEEGIKSAIEEGKEKFGLEVDEADIKEVLELMNTLEDMGFNTEAIISKAESLYQEYGVDFVDHTQELVVDTVKESIGNILKRAVSGFFRSIVESIKQFFLNLF